MSKLKVYRCIGNYRKPMPDWVPSHQRQSSERQRRTTSFSSGRMWGFRNPSKKGSVNDD